MQPIVSIHRAPQIGRARLRSALDGVLEKEKEEKKNALMAGSPRPARPCSGRPDAQAPDTGPTDGRCQGSDARDASPPVGPVGGPVEPSQGPGGCAAYAVDPTSWAHRGHIVVDDDGSCLLAQLSDSERAVCMSEARDSIQRIGSRTSRTSVRCEGQGIAIEPAALQRHGQGMDPIALEVARRHRHDESERRRRRLHGAACLCDLRPCQDMFWQPVFFYFFFFSTSSLFRSSRPVSIPVVIVFLILANAARPNPSRGASGQ
ncbi:hypothetical protein CDD83_9379 [Cordyceps sp. RAO-2017]|nr:hypothetical protein CDD83_9379 [Cordyceps sp. RAO-2017]